MSSILEQISRSRMWKNGMRLEQRTAAAAAAKPALNGLYCPRSETQLTDSRRKNRKESHYYQHRRRTYEEGTFRNVEPVQSVLKLRTVLVDARQISSKRLRDFGKNFGFTDQTNIALFVCLFGQLFLNVQYNGRSTSWNLYASLWVVLISFICLRAAVSCTTKLCSYSNYASKPAWE
jgi:hypothetical protein